MPRAPVPLTACVYVDTVTALKRIKGRWKTPLLRFLSEGGPRRYSDLRRALPAVSPKMLAQQLDALERDGLLVRREVESEPPKVVFYELTSLGAQVRPLLDAAAIWGRALQEARVGDVATCGEARTAPPPALPRPARSAPPPATGAGPAWS